MADIKEAIRRIAYKYTVDGADKVVAAQDAVTASTTKTDKASLSLEKSFNNLERRYVETVRAQQDYQKVQERVNAAVAQNPALQERANVVLAAAQARLSGVGKASDAAGQQIGLARHELINLSRQAQDVGVSLASGQSPLMVLAQQGAQIADVFIASGKSVGSFFAQATDWAVAFAKTPAGLVTGIAAIGAAVVAVMYQLTKSRTTVQEMLTEQKRLMDENKTSVYALIDAQIKLQTAGLTQFQLVRNEQDAREKLNQAMRDQVETAESLLRVVETPSADPTGATPVVQGAAYEKAKAALDALNAAIASGRPGIAEYNAELGRIGQAHPEFARIIEDAIGLQKEGLEVEQAWRRAAGAVRSAAEIKLGDRQGLEVAEKAKRAAEYALELAKNYSGVSVEVAKILDIQKAELNVANAIGETARINAQRELDILRAKQQGLSASEQTAIADGNRQKALAVILAQQAEIYDYTKSTNDLIQDGSAGATAEIKRRQGLVTSEASATRDIADSYSDIASSASKAGDATEFGSAAAGRFARNAQDAADSLGKAASYARSLAFWAESMSHAIDTRLDTLVTQFDDQGAGYTSSYDPLGLSRSKQSLEKLYGSENLIEKTFPISGGKYYAVDWEKLNHTQGKLTSSVDTLTDSTDSLNATMQDALSPFYSQDPRTTKLGFRAGTVGNPDWMTGAGNANPLDAVLGPGATAPGMATGGSFVVGGGYSANDNKVAMFPVASGEEVVVNRNRQRGSSAQVVHIDNRIIIQGSVDADTMAKLKISKYQQAQRMRAGLAQA